MIEKITVGGQLLAIILRSSYSAEGIEFFTPANFPQQLGFMNRPSGYEVLPHTHNAIPRLIENTQEALFIRSGSVRIDLYAPKGEYIESAILMAGDVVLFAYGGHGLIVLENAEIIEVKQGPYAGGADKKLLRPIQDDQVVIGPNDLQPNPSDGEGGSA